MRPRVPCTCQSGCLIIPVDCGTVLVCSTSIRSTTPLAPLDQSNPEPRECGTGSTYRWKCLKKSERFKSCLANTGQRAKKRDHHKYKRAHTSLDGVTTVEKDAMIAP